MAYFTSRGPIVAGDGNLLKPDITAPGVSVLAQVPNFNGYTARTLSGGQQPRRMQALHKLCTHECLLVCK
jgi:hypothetical protein